MHQVFIGGLRNALNKLILRSCAYSHAIRVIDTTLKTAWGISSFIIGKQVRLQL